MLDLLRAVSAFRNRPQKSSTVEKCLAQLLCSQNQSENLAYRQVCCKVSIKRPDGVSCSKSMSTLIQPYLDLRILQSLTQLSDVGSFSGLRNMHVECIAREPLFTKTMRDYSQLAYHPFPRPAPKSTILRSYVLNSCDYQMFISLYYGPPVYNLSNPKKKKWTGRCSCLDDGL
jgi:hypothetical protein